MMKDSLLRRLSMPAAGVMFAGLAACNSGSSGGSDPKPQPQPEPTPTFLSAADVQSGVQLANKEEDKQIQMGFSPLEEYTCLAAGLNNSDASACVRYDADAKGVESRIPRLSPQGVQCDVLVGGDVENISTVQQAVNNCENLPVLAEPTDIDNVKYGTPQIPASVKVFGADSMLCDGAQFSRFGDQLDSGAYNMAGHLVSSNYALGESFISCKADNATGSSILERAIKVLVVENMPPEYNGGTNHSVITNPNVIFNQTKLDAAKDYVLNNSSDPEGDEYSIECNHVLTPSNLFVEYTTSPEEGDYILNNPSANRVDINNSAQANITCTLEEKLGAQRIIGPFEVNSSTFNLPEE